MPLQNKMTPGRTNENLIILFFLFFLMFCCCFSAKLHICSQWNACVSVPEVHLCPSFLSLLIASGLGKGAILQPCSPLHLFTGLWPVTCDRRGCSGSIFIKSQWLTQRFQMCRLCTLVRSSCLLLFFCCSDAQRKAYSRCLKGKCFPCVYMCLVRGTADDCNIKGINYPYLFF